MALLGSLICWLKWVEQRVQLETLGSIHRCCLQFGHLWTGTGLGILNSLCTKTFPLEQRFKRPVEKLQRSILNSYSQKFQDGTSGFSYIKSLG